MIVFFTFSGQYADAQHDADSLTNILITFNLKNNLTVNKTAFNDSILDLFHKTEPTYKNDILPADLGNIGSAYISEIFFNRPDFYNRNFFFNLPYYSYLKNSENVLFYNTRRPYTSIKHTTSSKILDLQTIDFIHTQNINPNWNIGIRYNFISSLGQYLSEKKGLNSVGITTNYTKNKYSVYVSYIFNNLKTENSGGYNDTLGFDVKVPEPFLKNSGTLLYNQEFSVTQKYNFGKYKNLSYRDTIIKVPEPKISLSHNILFSRRYHLYKDEIEPENNYFRYNYLQNSFSNDSAAIQSMVNKIRLGSEEIFEEKYKFGFSAVYTNDWYRIYNFKDYIILQNNKTFFDNQFSGELYTINNKYLNAQLTGNYYFSGYRKNDFQVSTIVSKNIFKNKISSVLLFKGTYSDYTADYFETFYYSNHYIWENIFIPVKRTDFIFEYKLKKYNFNLNFKSGSIKNYIYYDINAVPVQFDSIINILSATADKTFKLHRITFVNKIIWQHSSEDNIISIPQLTIYHSSYVKLLYKNSLLIHLGFDVYYSTAYKAYNFNPAIGQFYFINNTKRLAGNYPYITVFANFKIKKNVLLFFKVSNLASGIISKDALPFYIIHYPIGGRMFKFGVKWTFKN